MVHLILSNPARFPICCATRSHELSFLSSSSVPCDIHIDIYFFLSDNFFWNFLPFFISANRQPLNKPFQAPLKPFHAAGTCLGRRHTNENSLPRFRLRAVALHKIHSVRIHISRAFVSILMAASVRFVGFLLPNVKEKSIRSYRRKWTKRCSTIIWDCRKRCAFELNLIYNSGLAILETTLTGTGSSMSGLFNVLSCRNLYICLAQRSHTPNSLVLPTLQCYCNGTLLDGNS